MNRKIVFTNALNQTLTASDNGNPFIILKVDGLGTPDTSIQEQKAPYQDGTTFIDALFNNREIVLEIGINAPNDFNSIDTHRRTLAQRFNPKLGYGSIIYTTEGGQEYKIACIPVTSPTFANKDYRDPYMRAQVTLLCNDPYWKKTTDDTINLPTSITSAETVIKAGNSLYPSVIQKSNGNLFVVYKRSSDNYIVSREFTTVWSGESVINAANSSMPCVIQKSNGNLFLVYSRASDNYLVSREYTSSWSSESVVNAANSIYPSLIQKSNGNLFVVYGRGAGNYQVSREYTVSWSGETVIYAAESYFASVLQKSNGNLILAYKRASDSYLVTREYTTAWSSETVINASDSYYPSLLEKSNGVIFVAYKKGAAGSIVSREYINAWSPEAVLNASNGFFPSVIQKTTGALFIVYARAPDYFLVSVERTITPVPAVVTGDYNTPIIVTFNGPSTNPRIVNNATLEFIRLNITLATGDTFVINTAFGQKTIVLTQGGIVKNGMAYLDIASVFFLLTPGTNTIYFEDDAVLSTATATLKWTERYVGV